jgi:hypothetical protein
MLGSVQLGRCNLRDGLAKVTAEVAERSRPDWAFLGQVKGIVERVSDES